MSGKHYIIATQDGYILDDVTGYPEEFHSKAAAAKVLAEIVRDAAKRCRQSYKTCSVVGSARKGSVQIKVGGRQGYHLWQRYLINERPGARKPPREKEGSQSVHHATKKKSSAQLNREIAEVLGRWEEDPFGGYRFITASDGVRFDTAGVDPTYYRDPKWRQRWEFDLKREIEKFKAGKPTKLYKMSETHYRLPGTV